MNVLHLRFKNSIIYDILKYLLGRTVQTNLSEMSVIIALYRTDIIIWLGTSWPSHTSQSYNIANTPTPHCFASPELSSLIFGYRFDKNCATFHVLCLSTAKFVLL